MKYGVMIISCVYFLGLPHEVGAVLPPDVIFNIGSQFAQLFSTIALVVGGVTGSIIVILRTHVLFVKTYGWAILATVLVLMSLSIAGFYIMEGSQNKKAYEEQLRILTEQLASSTRMITVHATSTDANPVSGTPETVWGTITGVQKIFNNDTIFLYGDDSGKPFYLEVDMNRKQMPNGLFEHYYYLVGVHDGVDVGKYHYSLSSTTTIVPTAFIQDIERKPFSDLSTREEYYGSVSLGDVPVSFEVHGIEGDFLTKNSPLYTRFESVGTGTVRFEGREISVHALVEKSYSDDFSKYVFFKGYDKLVALTRQFSLWDEAGNFYFSDQSNVTSNTPDYTSHTWLLHKNSAKGYTQKSFASEIIAHTIFGRPETTWSITAPDFNNARITLSLVKYIDDGDTQTRKRALVQGEITDTEGTRMISGFVHIVE